MCVSINQSVSYLELNKVNLQLYLTYLNVCLFFSLHSTKNKLSRVSVSLLCVYKQSQSKYDLTHTHTHAQNTLHRVQKTKNETQVEQDEVLVLLQNWLIDRCHFCKIETSSDC